MAARLESIRDRVSAACRAVGRDPAGVGLVGVTKRVSQEQIRQAHACGLRTVGESRTQEASAKIRALEDIDLEWHLIGHLQTNKVRDAVGRFALIHSVDSLHLLGAVGHEACKRGARQQILLQFNPGRDPKKFGFSLEEAEHAISAARATQGVELAGFMAIAPFFEDAEQTRPCFRALRELRDQKAPDLQILSMGMTHDFEVAIAEGATLVRIGTGIFGDRQSPPVPKSSQQTGQEEG